MTTHLEGHIPAPLAMSRLFLLSGVVLLGLSASGAAQNPGIVRDINAQPSGGTISGSPYAQTYQQHCDRGDWTFERFLPVGSRLFFGAYDLYGKEPWSCLSQPGSAARIANIYTTGSSDPKYWCASGSKAYFGATPGFGISQQLYESDGLSVTKLTNITGAGVAGHVFRPVAMGGDIYFCKTTAPSTSTLFKYDISAKTTTPLKTLSQPWEWPVILGSRIVFPGITSAVGLEAWVTDGTVAGTKPLRDYGGSFNGWCEYPIAVGAKVYFSTYDGISIGLWETDGTPANTKKVKTLPEYYHWYQPVRLGTRIVFGGANKGNPYVFDTASTTPTFTLLKAVRTGNFGVGCWNLVVMGSQAYFCGYETATSKWYVWKTNGTPGGTVKVTSKGVSGPYATGTYYWQMPTVIAAGSSSPWIAFRGITLSGSTVRYDLWKTDGTDTGTIQLSNFLPAGSDMPAYLTDFAGKCFFAANFGGVLGTELAVSDGTPGGTKLFQDLGKGSTGSSYPKYFVEMQGKAFFQANDGLKGSELWKSDGSAAGTSLVADLSPGASSSNPSTLFASEIAGQVYLLANPGLGNRLYSTDGTSTTMISTAVSSPSDFANKICLGSKVIFRGRDASHGFEPWVIDGSTVTLLKDSRTGLGVSGGFDDPCRIGDTVYFCAAGPGVANDLRLWKTDGTTTGTVPVALSGITGSIFDLRRCGQKLVFEATSTTKGTEPHVYDPTTMMTTVLDIQSGGSGYCDYPFSTENRVYFLARDNASSYPDYQLWYTDGVTATKVSTQAISKLVGTPEVHGNPIVYGLSLGSHSDSAVFWPYVATHGAEPWVTDGTAAGTFNLVIRYPGTGGSYFSGWRRVGSRKVVFGCPTSVGSSYKGDEMWVTDGTAGGTKLVSEQLNPASVSGWYSSSYSMGTVNGKVLFSGTKQETQSKGVELYGWSPGATAMSFGAGSGSYPTLRSDDPVLGSTMAMTLSEIPANTTGNICLGVRATNPIPLGNGAHIYINTGLFLLLSVNSAGSTSVSIPNLSALTGQQFAAQGLAGPTSTPPLGLDLTNGILLTLGL